jgi:hypothetical protein
MKKYTAPDYDLQANPSTDLPKLCEIRGCKSLYVGSHADGTEPLFKQGKADVLVDARGQKRGICCQHYAEIIDRSGKGRHSSMMDFRGNLTPDSIAEYHLANPVKSA